jgi:hypothetical protein
VACAEPDEVDGADEPDEPAELDEPAEEPEDDTERLADEDLPTD